ncbi:MAG: alpha/beta hydrolase, partial [Phenylobacterium sp.]
MAQADTQRMVLRKLLSLPTPLLRLMAGGGVVYQGGRTLDPHFQFLTAGARNLPGLHTLGAAEARAASAQGLAGVAGRREPGVRVEDLTIDGPGGDLALRAYRPTGQDPTAP